MALSPGVHKLGLGGSSGRDGELYIPDTDDWPAPLLVAFHGAGGVATHTVRVFLPLADSLGAVVLAPESRAQTWDVILGGFGPDVEFLDVALRHVVEQCEIDAERVFIGGFSDGASYALSIGVSRGDLYSSVVAFSPGFCRPMGEIGKPDVYVSHGVTDPILPIDATSRRLAPLLEQMGYEVTYREFDGGHVVPQPILAEAAEWLARRPPLRR